MQKWDQFKALLQGNSDHTRYSNTSLNFLPFLRIRRFTSDEDNRQSVGINFLHLIKQKFQNTF